MPTVAAYITAVLLIAPALIEAGIDLLAAFLCVLLRNSLGADAAGCHRLPRHGTGRRRELQATAGKSLALGAPLSVLRYSFVVNDSLLVLVGSGDRLRSSSWHRSRLHRDSTSISQANSATSRAGYGS